MAVQRYFWGGSPGCLEGFQGGEREAAQGKGRSGVVGHVGDRVLYIPKRLNVKVMFWGASQWWLKEHDGKEMQSQY